MRSEWFIVPRLGICLLLCLPAAGQAPHLDKPVLRAGRLPSDIRIDGVLDEPAWSQAEAIEKLTMVEPHEGAPPSMRTRVQVLADSQAIVIGVECMDPDPSGIVSFSKKRDPDMDEEDYIGIVLDPFMDGRSGYVFAVNPAGARFDGLVAPGGENVSEDWDAVWEAKTVYTGEGWSVELRIPVTSLTFKKGLTSWHFNVQRQIRRLQEVDRWAGPRRDWEVFQTSRAGLLTDLPEFDLGIGLTVRPAVTVGGGVPEAEAPVGGDFQPSLDVWQRVGPNLVSSLTVNTDFAETEVDTRRTNLTRFPLFFPEKRTFFLEGSDIFDFGIGLGEDIMPFFSRRIGLVAEQEVPIIVGGKLNGRVGDSNVGALVVGTNDVPGLVPEATMAVARLKQNLWDESWIGAIVTAGDPLGRNGSWLAGADFTYATSQLRGDKNFLVGLWGLTMDREDLGRDRQAWGLKIDYPNDLWDMAFLYKRIGRDFDPSLGFVPRPGVHLYTAGMTYAPRPNNWIRQMFYQLRTNLATDLGGRWESYRMFTAPVNVQLESGDRFELSVVPTGERLVEPFEVSDGVTIAPGSYEWWTYQLEIESASKRKLSGEFSWGFGGFYDGNLDQIQLGVRWSPSAFFTLELSAERNNGRLPAGDFAQDVLGTRVQFNMSPDLTLSSYIQYDNQTETVGSNSRLRWTFHPLGDLFVIYNHNIRDFLDRWALDSNQLLVKLQYAWRY